MRNTIVRCGSCSSALTLPDRVGVELTECLRCGSFTQAWLFPALYRRSEKSAAQTLLDEGDSSCMNHPNKRAVVVCDGCGKYLCALCDIDWNGEHLCPSCIAHNKSADTSDTLRTEYVYYDVFVLVLALVAILTSFFGLFVAPVAIFVGIRYWKAPLRPVPHRKWVMIAGIALATMIFIVWLSMTVFFLSNI